MIGSLVIGCLLIGMAVGLAALLGWVLMMPWRCKNCGCVNTDVRCFQCGALPQEE